MSTANETLVKPRWSLKHDRLALFFGQLTIEILWPVLYIRGSGNWRNPYGIFAQTTILFTSPRNWAWHTAFVVQVLGLGIGVAWDHCENPNYVGGRVDPR